MKWSGKSDGKRYLIGLIGRGILASRSPYMHESEADAQGLRLIYTLFDFAELDYGEADLPRMLEAAELTGFAGVNVTHPYKQTVIEHLNELTPHAQRVGAVNTVAFIDQRRIGHNTDVIGFAASFESGLHGAAINDVVQIGAGGAGAATAHALLGLGVRQLTIFDLDESRADALIENLAGHFDRAKLVAGHDLRASMSSADGVVNATPMGMAEHPGMALSSTLLRPDLWVADVVYFPLETELLAAARAQGCRTLDGSGMAVRQAAAAFEIFTGREADAQRMAVAFRSLG